jgi:hypothetical protein
MITKKLITKTVIFSVVFLAAGLTAAYFVTANTCPANTEVGETQATLVGEITDDGGDPNLEVWFQYGKTSSSITSAFESTHAYQTGLGSFCAVVTGLDSCTTYYYRAVAQNSAGTSYGEIKSFKTLCVPEVTVDLKANGSNGPVDLKYGDSVTLSWSSSNASFCEVSGDWSGSKQTSGSALVQLDSLKTYTFSITCRNADGSKTGSDSVEVRVSARPPVVIIKPAIVTR